MSTIEKRGEGYRITVSLGYDINGKQIKKRKTWVPAPNLTEKQLQKELERQKVLFEEQCKSGQYIDSSIRFAEFADLWLHEYAEKQLRPSTVVGYKDMLRRINNAIGNIRLDRLQPNHLMQFYNKLAENGVRRDFQYISKVDMPGLLKARKTTRKSLAEQCGLAVQTVSLAAKGKPIAIHSAEKIANALGKPINKLFDTVERKETLSGKTILHHHRLISSILEKAVKWQVIFYNPCTRVEPPKAEKKEADYLDEIQAAQLIECLQDEPLQYRTIILTLLYTGMRRGELCGLTWSDIDFKNGLIDINKTSLYLPEQGIFDDRTKTQSSNRVIKVSSEVIEILKQHKLEQAKTRFLLGDRWTESGKVFTQSEGKPIHPDTITGWFAQFIQRHNLPPIHLHSLRHTNATLLIAGGADLRTVSKRLGHSNMTTTGNIYTHAIQTADERAADLLQDILKPAGTKRA